MVAKRKKKILCSKTRRVQCWSVNIVWFLGSAHMAKKWQKIYLSATTFKNLYFRQRALGVFKNPHYNFWWDYVFIWMLSATRWEYGQRLTAFLSEIYNCIFSDIQSVRKTSSPYVNWHQVCFLCKRFQVYQYTRDERSWFYLIADGFCQYLTLFLVKSRRKCHPHGISM